ncbi:MAG: DUF393 domain-containing protein [Thermomicrobiales bacterium]|nr:DUF393 domain-containing protein [Thermomicrobiales bacterium]
MKVTVIFDGECGVCTRTIRFLREHDKRHVLTFRPCQTIPDGGWHEIRPADCARAVWAVGDDGHIAYGSDAAFLILAVMWNNWWPWRLGTLPGVRQVGQAVYRVIANNRRRLPGDTPWCEQHPHECEQYT